MDRNAPIFETGGAFVKRHAVAVDDHAAEHSTVDRDVVPVVGAGGKARDDGEK
jgi:hypothetical protein